MPIDNNYTGTTKSILRQRDIGASIMTRVITTGEDTYLLFDPWINHKSLFDLLGWNKIHLCHTVKDKVSHIVHEGQFQPQLLSEAKEVATHI